MFFIQDLEGGIFIFRFRLFRKRDSIHFSGRRHTGLGILSAIFGIITVLGFITTCIISGVNKGEGGTIIGIIGILLFVLSLIGFVLSYKALKQKDIFYRFPITGMIANGFMLIIFMIIYILGIIR